LSRILENSADIKRVEFLDFDVEAKRVLESAKSEARRIIAIARGESDSTRKCAYDEGYAAGLREGGEAGLEQGVKQGAVRAQQEFQARTADLSSVLEGMLSEFSSRREQMLEAIRADALAFLIDCVERMARREVSFDKEAVARSLMDGLALVTSSPVKVEVNPSDLDYLNKILPDIMSENPVEGVRVVPTEDLELGDVRLSHPEGSADLSLKAQMEVIRTAFLGGGNGAV